MNLTNLKQLFEDEDAVSPVIGVILMVAITVILAAVIGTFVLGLGENVQDSAPQANFQFEYDDGGDGFGAGDANDAITITHTGGEDVDNTNVDVLIGGDASDGTWSATTIETGVEFSHTDSAAADAESGDTVRVVWTSPSGSNSNTIGSSTVPA